MSVRIIAGDCLAELRKMPPESVHCVVTSPPYYGLRDYGAAGQIGLEPDFRDYVARLVEVFREVRRALRSDGTLWLNLGDSYATGAGGVGARPGGGAQGDAWAGYRGGRNGSEGKHAYGENNGGVGPMTQPNRMPQRGLKPKDLMGIPWRVAFALQDDGWWLRQDIVWAKPNPMPESVTDRCTKSHEYLFLLSKSQRYHFDQEAILEPISAATVERLSQPALEEQLGSLRVPGKINGPMKAVSRSGNAQEGVRNKRSVWTVTTIPFSEAHFATFPPALIEPCVKAGTSEKGCCARCGSPWARLQERTVGGVSVTVPAQERFARRPDGAPLMGDNAFTQDETERGSFAAKNGVVRKADAGWAASCECGAGVTPCTVLDPFGGAGTTGLVADRLGRDAVLIEINPEYADMAQRRIEKDAGLFASVAAE